MFKAPISLEILVLQNIARMKLNKPAISVEVIRKKRIFFCTSD
jgi:hypothetical protein